MGKNNEDAKVTVCKLFSVSYSFMKGHNLWNYRHILFLKGIVFIFNLCKLFSCSLYNTRDTVKVTKGTQFSNLLISFAQSVSIGYNFKSSWVIFITWVYLKRGRLTYLSQQFVVFHLAKYQRYSQKYWRRKIFRFPIFFSVFIF